MAIILADEFDSGRLRHIGRGSLWDQQFRETANFFCRKLEKMRIAWYLSIFSFVKMHYQDRI